MRILYVDVDTLRADHTGPYGYQRAITPNLDSLARDSVVLERCYASDTPCAPVEGRPHQWAVRDYDRSDRQLRFSGGDPHVRSHPVRPLVRRPPLPQRDLHRLDLLLPGTPYGVLVLEHFHEWLKPSLSNGDDEDAATVTTAARQWLQRNGRNDDWFLQVHFWDPHIPYLEPLSWVRRASEAGPAPNLAG